MRAYQSRCSVMAGAVPSDREVRRYLSGDRDHDMLRFVFPGLSLAMKLSQKDIEKFVKRYRYYQRQAFFAFRFRSV